MGDQESLKQNVTVWSSRDEWIAAYSEWYHHFLDMQKEDYIGQEWAKRMTEATLLDFYMLKDKMEIRQIATTLRKNQKYHPETSVMTKSTNPQISLF